MQLIERSRQHADIVCYLPQYEVAVCTECHYVLNKSPSIGRHLVTTHFWSKTEATAVDQKFNDKAIRSPNHPNCTWILPKPDDPPIPHLTTHDNGYGCHICKFVCRSKQTIVNHYSTRHREVIHRKPLKELYRQKVSVQSFTNGANNQCFEVNKGKNDTKPTFSPIICSPSPQGVGKSIY